MFNGTDNKAVAGGIVGALGGGTAVALLPDGSPPWMYLVVILAPMVLGYLGVWISPANKPS